MKKLIAIIFAIPFIFISPAEAFDCKPSDQPGVVWECSGGSDEYNSMVAAKSLNKVCLHSGALYYAKFSSGSADIKENLSYVYPTAGESHRADSSMFLLKKYGKTFDPKNLPILEKEPYKVFTTKATLIPEPTNKFDKFAVKVVIKGKHVSYIPSTVSYDVSYMMKKSKNKTLTVNACISHYPGGEGPQVSLDLKESFLGEDYDQLDRMFVWQKHNDSYEQGPGAKCTKYFSKWYCGPFEK